MVIDIPPVMNRLVLFWSDERMPHEVRPAHAMRSVRFIDESRFTKFHGSNDGSSSTSKAPPPHTNTVAPNTSSAARLLSALENRLACARRHSACLATRISAARCHSGSRRFRSWSINLEQQ